MLRSALTSLFALRLATGTVGPAPLPVERYCEGHPVQERFLKDESRVRVLICGRRTGKTVGLIVEAIRTMLKYTDEPDVYVLYVTKTAKNAKKQFWKPLKRMLRDSGHRFKSNEQDLTLELEAGGGGLLVAGADNKEQIEKYRGWAFALAIVDECGVYPSGLLESLIDEVLEPATADVGGRIVLAGTPGPTMTGTWYDYSGPAASGPHVHRGTLLDNPHMRRDLPPEERREALIHWLAEMRKGKKWNEDHPTYVREWLGLWAQDDEALVFPLSANGNDYQGGGQGPWGLPTVTASGFPLAHSDWRVVIGIDVGQTSPSAYVVLATHPSLKRTYIVHAEKHAGQLIGEMARLIRHLKHTYAVRWGGQERVPSVVIDSGGMGKQHAEELRRVMGIPNEAADKRDKASAISVTRDAIRAGRLQLLRVGIGGDDPTKPLSDELHVLVWNDKRDGIADGQDDHCTDAMLYGYRKIRDYTKQEPAPGPKPGTREWANEEAAKMERAALRQHNQQQRQAKRQRRKAGKVA